MTTRRSSYAVQVRLSACTWLVPVRVARLVRGDALRTRVERRGRLDVRAHTAHVRRAAPVVALLRALDAPRVLGRRGLVQWQPTCSILRTNEFVVKHYSPLYELVNLTAKHTASAFDQAAAVLFLVPTQIRWGA